MLASADDADERRLLVPNDGDDLSPGFFGVPLADAVCDRLPVRVLDVEVVVVAVEPPAII